MFYIDKKNQVLSLQVGLFQDICGNLRSVATSRLDFCHRTFWTIFMVLYYGTWHKKPYKIWQNLQKFCMDSINFSHRQLQNYSTTSTEHLIQFRTERFFAVHGLFVLTRLSLCPYRWNVSAVCYLQGFHGRLQYPCDDYTTTIPFRALHKSPVARPLVCSGSVSTKRS